MLNQRLLAALLALTTVTATVAVNVYPSYGQIGQADDVVVQGNRTFRRVWNATKQAYELIAIPGGIYGTYQAGEAAKKWYDNRNVQPQPQKQPQGRDNRENLRRVNEYLWRN